MITLCVNDPNQLNLLAIELDKNDIAFQVVVTKDDKGIGFPHILVDGVPLDLTAAFAWITERNN